ncbi:hypothetical protein KCMC57_up20820 [Kitasatospora sp. CMC57]|uniref:Uncharacterized protein n=1 Tax=Kitasatospora sp. CMC57 TaxID=3231513 RepID=A0AB33JST6_9ACTN
MAGTRAAVAVIQAGVDGPTGGRQGLAEPAGTPVRAPAPGPEPPPEPPGIGGPGTVGLDMTLPQGSTSGANPDGDAAPLVTLGAERHF